MPIMHHQHFIPPSREGSSDRDGNYHHEGSRYPPPLKPISCSGPESKNAPCSQSRFGRLIGKHSLQSDESDASQASEEEDKTPTAAVVPTAKGREKLTPPSSVGRASSSQEQPSKQQSNTKAAKLARRKALQSKVDKELSRVEEALALFRERVAYEASSPASQQKLESELDKESEVLLNNLLWLYKKENGITNLGLNLEIILEGMDKHRSYNLSAYILTQTAEHIGSGDETVKQELSRTREPLGNSFIPTNNLQGFFPGLLDEINERYSAIMGNKTEDDNSTLDLRLDLATNPPTYTFTDIRKEIGLYEQPGVSKRELDKTWKVFRREVRDEIASENLRDIRKSIEPDRLHSETLRIARKMLSQQQCWKEANLGHRKLEKLAYALVCREYALIGETAAGFGPRNKNGLENRSKRSRRTKARATTTQTGKLPPKRGRTSIRKETTYLSYDNSSEDSENSRYNQNDRKRPRKSRRCATTRSTTHSPTTEENEDADTEETDEHEGDTNSPNPSPPIYVVPKLPSGASVKLSTSKKGTAYNDISLAQRRDLVEIKRMELEAEEMWLAVSEKKESFEKKYGVSCNPF
ncbi:hypothetical protein BDD12DRAFT_800826 [Trichophaea hybrida]|nr:hypothetical protein BDD12DRAFT_800826 [Trichophaea hybrida]